MSPTHDQSTGITRRAFVAGTATLGATLAAGAAAQSASPDRTRLENTYLVHHVFFWLKNPDSAEDLAALLEGIRSLGGIPEVRAVHAGIPADTEKRPVVESSYHASEILLFDSLEDQTTYQAHPLHQKFVDEHSHRWGKVMVFDTMRAD